MFNGQYAEAEPVLRKAMRVYELNLFHVHPVEIRGDLAAADVAKGDLPAADSMLKEAAEKARTYHIPVARCDPIKSLDELADKREEAGDGRAAQALRRAAAEARKSGRSG